MKAALVGLVLLSFLAPPARAGEETDLVTTAREHARLATLSKALERAGLLEQLGKAGPFTLFAPTDAAFAALAEDELRVLRAVDDVVPLRRLLAHHLIAGRVLARDLWPRKTVRSMAGEELRIPLRVGDANVVQSDLLCTNGVIHVVDRVLVPSGPVGRGAVDPPPAATTTSEHRARVTRIISAALDRGVLQFNRGEIPECARTYGAAVAELQALPGLSALDRHELARAVDTTDPDAEARAWTLRRAMDRVQANARYEPTDESPRPEGFPAPGPLGHVVVLRYPRCRVARTAGESAFWSLFQHLQRNKIEMTAPVVMTLDDALHMQQMAFVYGRPAQGQAGVQGDVTVVDEGPVAVISIGMRGPRDAEALSTARSFIEAHVRARGERVTGAWRLLGYNSPIVPAAQQFWELQLVRSP